jgi:CheY-like chemotaxis protein
MVHILVIDDDPFILRMIDRMLTGNDRTITAAHSGPEGMESYRRSPSDLVITDVAMPASAGLETIRGLRALGPSLPILAISGGGWLVAGSDLLDLACQAGATAALAKPFTTDQLRDAVSLCLQLVKVGSA